MSEALHDNCFDICATKAPELPFLSVQEGTCMRNCITKFSVFYPTLRINLEHADYRHTEQVYLQEAQKKNADIRKAFFDPWEKDRNNLLEEYIRKRQAHQWAAIMPPI